MSASTIHNLFDMDNTYASKLDFSKGNTEKVARLVQMEVLLLDEVSMLDCDIFSSVTTLLNLCDHTRKGRADPNADEFGDCHIILFGDFKHRDLPGHLAPTMCTTLVCDHFSVVWLELMRDERRRPRQLPPATSKTPFCVLPFVHRLFDFRVLRENRRVIDDPSRKDITDEFHEVLADVSFGRCTDIVKTFIVRSYVRGARNNTAETCPLEKVTSVFTKRRYRDSWNRCLMRKIAKSHNHSMKVRGMVRAKGQRGSNWHLLSDHLLLGVCRHPRC